MATGHRVESRRLGPRSTQLSRRSDGSISRCSPRAPRHTTAVSPQSDRRIFLSYRRKDSSGHVGRLFDALVAALGRDSVFMDIDTLAPGQDFVQEVDGALSHCSAMLVLIGPGWLSIRDASGQRRLEDGDDYVRIEIERALTQGSPCDSRPGRTCGDADRFRSPALDRGSIAAPRP